MKCPILGKYFPLVPVAPLAGAWIEMIFMAGEPGRFRVAPLAGAWIEIFPLPCCAARSESHPSRVRGLKFSRCRTASAAFYVAPLAGAWIEIVCS